MRRCRQGRINGDDFEKGVMSDGHDGIMCSHEFMLAALRNADAKGTFNVIHPGPEPMTGDNDMI